MSPWFCTLWIFIEQLSPNNDGSLVPPLESLGLLRTVDMPSPANHKALLRVFSQKPEGALFERPSFSET